MRVVNKRRSFGQEMNKEKFHVWWKPQVPMESFLVEVDSVEEGYKLLRVLEGYDFFSIILISNRTMLMLAA